MDGAYTHPPCQLDTCTPPPPGHPSASNCVELPHSSERPLPAPPPTSDRQQAGAHHVDADLQHVQLLEAADLREYCGHLHVEPSQLQGGTALL
eukprot:265189-Prorocentrum_minimum.AAC.1